MSPARLPKGKARGGVIRARRLSKEERHNIAMEAASARWKELPMAVAGSETTPLRIANVELECYVLGDGTRVLSQAGFLSSLGRHRKAWVRSDEGVPAILQSQALKSFITDEILKKSRPITFLTRTGARANGYRAELLPEVCEMYLKARDAGSLASNQKHVAKQAEILIRAFANVGIIALVDEATGYQEVRARNALAEILEQFIAKELQAWVKTFPDDYYRQMFRLRGLNFPKDLVKRPQYFGILTNDVVYKRLAPGVLEELKRVTPRGENGRTTSRYFQRLTANMGYPKLREHLGSVVTIMKLSDGWGQFVATLDRIHPRFNTQLSLPLAYDESADDGKGL